MLALIPLALGRTEGALIASELGRTVIGGLFSSTLLTLVVIPVVYSLVDGLRSSVGRKKRLPSAEAVLSPASGGS
jgi:HAE1 family hydrophobic/amphiphilic exporter-1